MGNDYMYPRHGVEITPVLIILFWFYDHDFRFPIYDSDVFRSSPLFSFFSSSMATWPGRGEVSGKVSMGWMLRCVAQCLSLVI